VAASPAHRCGIIALVLLLAVGHSAGIQAFAWMTMIVDRAQTVSISEAISSTLNGIKPCPLCKAAKAFAWAEAGALPAHAPGKAPQKSQMPVADKWMVEDAWMMHVNVASSDACYWSHPQHQALSYSSAPPTPPPRA